MIKISRLVNTYRIPSMFLGEDQYVIRIEIWQRQTDSLFFATIDRAFHCDLVVSSERRSATELIWTAEETLGVDDSYFESEENTLNHAVAMMSKIYLPSNND
jgi:hypothetical protein